MCIIGRMPRSCKNRPFPMGANLTGAPSATAGENINGAGFGAGGFSPDSHAGRLRLQCRRAVRCCGFLAVRFDIHVGRFVGSAQVLCLVALCVLLAFPLMGFMGQGPLGGEQISTSGVFLSSAGVVTFGSSSRPLVCQSTERFLFSWQGRSLRARRRMRVCCLRCQ